MPGYADLSRTPRLDNGKGYRAQFSVLRRSAEPLSPMTKQCPREIDDRFVVALRVLNKPDACKTIIYDVRTPI